MILLFTKGHVWYLNLCPLLKYSPISVYKGHTTAHTYSISSLPLYTFLSETIRLVQSDKTMEVSQVTRRRLALLTVGVALLSCLATCTESRNSITQSDQVKVTENEEAAPTYGVLPSLLQMWKSFATTLTSAAAKLE